MLQYRVDRGTCVHRMFTVTNSSNWVDNWLYGKCPHPQAVAPLLRCRLPRARAQAHGRLLLPAPGEQEQGRLGVAHLLCGQATATA